MFVVIAIACIELLAFVVCYEVGLVLGLRLLWCGWFIGVAVCLIRCCCVGFDGCCFR